MGGGVPGAQAAPQSAGNDISTQVMPQSGGNNVGTQVMPQSGTGKYGGMANQGGGGNPFQQFQQQQQFQGGQGIQQMPSSNAYYPQPQTPQTTGKYGGMAQQPFQQANQQQPFQQQGGQPNYSALLRSIAGMFGQQGGAPVSNYNPVQSANDFQLRNTYQFNPATDPSRILADKTWAENHQRELAEKAAREARAARGETYGYGMGDSTGGSGGSGGGGGGADGEAGGPGGDSSGTDAGGQGGLSRGGHVNPNKQIRAALLTAKGVQAKAVPGKSEGGDIASGDNFKSWFGNSVAHEDGVPMRFYHGTSKDKDFTSFNMGRHGVWLTADPKEASMYAQENDSQGHVYEDGKFTPTNTASRVMPVYLKAENPYTGERPEHVVNASNYKKAQSDWFDQLRAKGHDSWIPESANGRLAVALKHPTQIKSAVSNTGKFSSSDKHIGKMEGGALAAPGAFEEEPQAEFSVSNPMPVFPKPQRMWDDQRPGGAYLSMPDKADVTGHRAAQAEIGVKAGGKPFFNASRDAVEATGTPGRGSAIVKTNLFKKKAGWQWAQAPEGHEATDTIVSVDHRGKHHYALNVQFPKGVDLSRYEKATSEPRLRPTTKGNLEFGEQAGTILVRGKEHPVYHNVIVRNTGGRVGYAGGGGEDDPVVQQALGLTQESMLPPTGSALNHGDTYVGQNAPTHSEAGSQAGELPFGRSLPGGEGVVPSQHQAPLEGLPTRIKIPLTGEVITAGPNHLVRSVAEQYMRDAGLPYNPPKKYAKVDLTRGKRISNEYEQMEDNANHPLVKAAYDAMVKETMAQYRAAKAAGLKLSFWNPEKEKNPYEASPRLVIKDVNENHHMYVFPTQFGFGSKEISPEDVKRNPLLAPTGEHWNGIPVTVNDVFRAVHDYFGHAKEGSGFRSDGEENAWRSHASMYSPLARLALTSETRGQNSWLNFGPHGENNRNASTENTVFAPQKVGIMPAWTAHEGAEDFITPEDRKVMEKIHKQYGRSSGGRIGYGTGGGEDDPTVRHALSLTKGMN